MNIFYQLGTGANAAIDAGFEILKKPDGMYHVTEEVRKLLEVARMAFEGLKSVGGAVSKYSVLFAARIKPLTTCLGGAAGFMDVISFVANLNYFRTSFVGDVKERNVHNILVNAGYTTLGAVCTAGFAVELGVVQLGKLAAGVVPAIFGALAIAYTIDHLATTYTTVRDFLRVDEKIQAAAELLKKEGTEDVTYKERNIQALKSQLVREYVIKTIKLATGILFAVVVLTTLALPTGGIGLAAVITLGILASGTAILYEIASTQAVRKAFNNWYLGEEHAAKGVLFA